MLLHYHPILLTLSFVLTDSFHKSLVKNLQRTFGVLLSHRLHLLGLVGFLCWAIIHLPQTIKSISLHSLTFPLALTFSLSLSCNVEVVFYNSLSWEERQESKKIVGSVLVTQRVLMHRQCQSSCPSSLLFCIKHLQ